jgi:hypothetical protein
MRQVLRIAEWAGFPRQRGMDSSNMMGNGYGMGASSANGGALQPAPLTLTGYGSHGSNIATGPVSPTAPAATNGHGHGNGALPLSSSGDHSNSNGKSPAATLDGALAGAYGTQVTLPGLDGVRAHQAAVKVPLSAHVDGGIHSKEDRDIARILETVRAEIFFVLLLLISPFFIFFAICAIVAGDSHLAIWLGACTLALWCIPYILKRTRSVSLCGHLMAIAWVISLTPFIIRAGGASSPSVFALWGLPFCATTFSSHREVYVWVGISVAIPALLLAIHFPYCAEYTSPPLVTLFRSPWILTVFTILGLLWSHILLRLADNGRRPVMDQLTRTRETAEQASAAKGAFLTTMSHEMRTPLHGILGLTSFHMGPTTGDGMMDDSYNDGPTCTAECRASRGDMSSINTLAKHLLDLINDILDLGNLYSCACLRFH